MKKMMILYITDNGRHLAERVEKHAPGSEIARFAPGVVAERWNKHEAFVFIMASGIVVRTIAPLLEDKRTDPAVVVLDEAGKYCVSLAGGHLGGANELAKELAGFLGAEAVITTASDVNGLPSVDLWARRHDLEIEDWGLLPLIGKRFVNNGALRVYSDAPLDFPDDFLRVADPRFADLIITNKKDAYAGSSEEAPEGESCRMETCRVKGQLYLRPRNLALGIGCNSGTSGAEIEEAVRAALEEGNLSFLSVAEIGTIDLKGKEPGLREFIGKHTFALRTFTPRELNGVQNIEKSDPVFRATGAYAVAEPAALLVAGAEKPLLAKRKRGNVTVAVAEKKPEGTSKKPEKKGKIYVVGTGPGSLEHMTRAAMDAIRQSDVIVGYGTYLGLIRELLQDKEVVSTGMTQEADRCGKAIELARAGKTVSVISGGDPGVYAMAGLVYELLKKRSAGSEERGEELPRVEVVPGISALNAVASRLGAPLMHDFACISLSDRLTPWDAIEKRLDAAAAADFVIVLYNPRSKGRAEHLDRARRLILKHRAPETIAGIVKGAMRGNERIIVTELGRMKDEDVDMQTTVVIGNSKTFVWNNLMITPRGYEVATRGEG
jgi:cobalt-precorrin 5A hydrolase / cobalt-factor III methyltransferase / precorrin-3B C17-methyltransferase